MTPEKLELERSRLDQMKKFEREYSDCFHLIAGADEAGRGPLAGPVCAAVCMLPYDSEILRLNDSKKLSEKRREELFDEIKEKALAYGIALVGNEEIDRINILEATKKAMKEALSKLSPAPDMLFVDALTLPDIPMKQLSIIKGDAKSVNIAAASILAKVTRDRLMKELDQKYPEYGFAKHKGYGTKAHYEALKKYGPCPIHRMTFLKNIEDH